MPELGRRGFGVGVGAMLLACERTRAPTDAGEGAGAGPSSTPAKVGPLRRVAALDSALGAPLQLVPRGDAVMVVLRGGFAIVDGSGEHATPLGSIAERRAVATATGWCVGSLHVGARGEPGASLRGAGSLDEPGARQLALRVEGDDWITAAMVQGNDRAPALVVTRRSPEGGPRWSFAQPGRAAAAIDESGALALVTFDGRLRVLGDPSAGQDGPRVLVDAAIDPPGYAITFDRRGLCVLAAIRDDAHREGGDRIAAPVDWRPALAWSTEVLELSRDGVERTRATVAFAGLQAPVRLADGAVAVVGMGAARIVDGAVTWTRSSAARMHACAAADELVLGCGDVVERVGPGGDMRGRDVLGGESVACAPAVDGEGRVWIATTRALWRIG